MGQVVGMEQYGVGVKRGTAVVLLLCAAWIGLLAIVAASAAATVLVPAAGSPFPSGGTQPRAIATGDFNNDGRTDAVVANQVSDDVSVLLGNGLGALAPSSRFPFSSGGTTPVSSAVGDFNGDRNLDLAVANQSSNTVSLQLGDGHGGLFPGSLPLPTGGAGAVSVAVGDFNDDGKLDVAVANHASNNVSVLLGDGQGGLSPATGSPFPAGIGPSSIAVGDFNGDGKLDVAVANAADGTVSVLLGDGRGALHPAPGSPFSDGGLHPAALAVGDFNGDRKLDVAVANYSSGDVTVMLGNGRGGLDISGAPFVSGGRHLMSVAAADLNGDGRLDVAVAHSSGDISLLLGDGAGALSPAIGSPVPSGSHLPTSIAIGDLNGDARPDLVVAHQSGDISVLLNLPNGPNAGPLGSSPCTIVGGSTRMRRGGRVDVRVLCPLAATGTLTLEAVATVRGRGGSKRKARKQRLAIGRARFRAAHAARTVTVHVRLSRRGRALVKKARHLHVNAIASVREQGSGAKSGRISSARVLTITR